jgi:hypothetical protein
MRGLLFLALTVTCFGQTPAPSIFTVVPVPNIRAFPFHSDLAAVSASSGSDIWAVGESAVHFDGTKWSAFALPEIAGDLTSGMTAIADLAPHNVWAVGNVNIGEANPHQVIEHFDGTQWSVSTGPSFQSTDQPTLNGLAATTPANMWAAGAILTLINGVSTELLPLFEHFNGSSWKAIFDESVQNGFLYGISSSAANNVWAVGSVAFASTLIEHFDGLKWKRVLSPNNGSGQNVLLGVAALSATDVWAVGWSVQALNQDRPQQTLVEHWDGQKWSVVPSPNVGGPNTQSVSNELRGIIAVSAQDIWAFGETDFFGPEEIVNLVMHWDGTSWTIVPAPDPNPRHVSLIDDVISGGIVIPQGNLWLVGVADGFGAMVLTASGQ